MKFLWNTLRVKDLEKSVSFYQEILGLDVSRRFASGSGAEIVFLGVPNDIEIELIADAEAVGGSGDLSMGFEVESLEQTVALLNEKGIAFTGPVSPNESLHFIHLADPDGIRIQLVEYLQ